jgi:hypothetical protein
MLYMIWELQDIILVHEGLVNTGLEMILYKVHLSAYSISKITWQILIKSQTGVTVKAEGI